MIKRFALTVLIVGALMLPSMLMAAEAADEGEKKFVVTGDLRLRWERLENYFDFDDDTDDAYSFFPYRARVGVKGELANDVEVVMDIQNFGSFGNQGPVQNFNFFSLPPFQHFDGDGASAGIRSSETSLYQANVKLNKIAGSGLGLTLGRQEFELGTGLILGNEEYYNGTVYDGLKAMWDFENWTLTGFYFVTSERNDFANDAFTSFGSDDQHIEGLAGSFHTGGRVPSHINGYVINFQDGDEDNLRPNWLTVGGHWWRKVEKAADTEGCPFDWNLEIAFQDGEGTFAGDDFDLGGNVIDASIGYNLAAGETIHRFHGGVIRQSGDDDLTDNDFKGWNVLFPRSHGRFGKADYFGANFGSPLFAIPTGITAWRAGYSLNMADGKHMFGLSGWWFAPTEDKIKGVDLDGDGRDDKFDDLGTEVDLGYRYQYSSQVSLGAGVAVLFPDDGLTGSGAPDDPVTRITSGIRVKF